MYHANVVSVSHIHSPCYVPTVQMVELPSFHIDLLAYKIFVLLVTRNSRLECRDQVCIGRGKIDISRGQCPSTKCDECRKFRESI